MIKIKKYVISFIVVVVLVVLGSWAFLVTQDDVAVDNPNTKVELKRTTDAYGDMPFESDKLKEHSDFRELKELAETDERVFLLSDGEWIETAILDQLYERYKAVQEGLEHLKNKDVIEKWKWNNDWYALYISAFEADILQDHPDKAEYIEALYDAEWTARQAIEDPKQLKDDKVVKEVEAKIEKARELREQ